MPDRAFFKRKRNYFAVLLALSVFLFALAAAATNDSSGSSHAAQTDTSQTDTATDSSANLQIAESNTDSVSSDDASKNPETNPDITSTQESNSDAGQTGRDAENTKTSLTSNQPVEITQGTDNTLSESVSESDFSDKNDNKNNKNDESTNLSDEIYLDLDKIIDVNASFSEQEAEITEKTDNSTHSANEFINDSNSDMSNTSVKDNNASDRKIQNDSLNEEINLSDISNNLDLEDENSGDYYEYINIDEIQARNNSESKKNPDGSTKNSSSNESGSIKDADKKTKKVPYVLYKHNKKEIETEISSIDEAIEINKEEAVITENDKWKKKVKVFSQKHFNNSLTVYADVEETSGESISVFWVEENKYIEFQSYDNNNNGLIDRISWIVPHLSEQNFEIIVNITINQTGNETANTTLSDKSITINPISFPSGTINYSLISFYFEVHSENISSLECNFSLSNSTSNIVSKDLSLNNNTLDYSLNLSNGAYNWDLICYDLNSSISNSTSGNFYIMVSYPPTIYLSASNNSINEGDSVTFAINITSETNYTIYYILDYGDGNKYVSFPPETTDSLSVQLAHTYADAGNYTVNLSVYADYAVFERTLNVKVNSLVFNDTSAPEITLLDPEDEETIKIQDNNSKIKFSYKASDNAKVDNCTFELYYYGNSVVGSLTYSETKNITDDEVEIELTDFDEGDYSWSVICYDNSSNSNEVQGDFTVVYEIEENLSETSENNNTNATSIPKEDAEKIDEIDSLISGINDFFVKEEKYSSKEKEAIEDMGLYDELKFYKKKLLQMKLDLEHNLDYVRDEDRREERREEILNEIEDIKRKIPYDLKVTDSYEYYKNSLEFNMQEVVDSYIKANEIVLDKGKLNELVKRNEELQEYISTSAKVKHLEIYYNFSNDGSETNRIDKITLIAKEIKLKNSSVGVDSIIEVIPKDAAESADEVEFINKDVKILNPDPVFEIAFDNIEDNKIVYYIQGFIDMEDIEKTTTLSFKESFPENNGIISGLTGFALISDFSVADSVNKIGFYLSWIIAIAIIAVIGTVSYRKLKTEKLKKKREFREVFNIMADIESALKEKDIDAARKNYYSAKELYNNLPDEGKEIVYRKLKKLCLEIDKKDMGILIKEFSLAIREGRKEDALTIYKDIRKIYHRMPLRYKKIVYEKVIPYVKDIEKTI